MEPNQRVYESLDKIELILVELSMMACTTKSVFPEGKIPTEYLEIFKKAGLCKSQWVRDALWYKYPILRQLAPTLSGYTWHINTLTNLKRTLEKVVDLHREKPGTLFSSVMEYTDLEILQPVIKFVQVTYVSGNIWNGRLPVPAPFARKACRNTKPFRALPHISWPF